MSERSPRAFTTAEQVTEYLSHDRLECLECGRRYELLPGHLKWRHGLSAEEYRNRYNLPAGAPLAGIAYRETGRARMLAMIAEGTVSHDHLPDAVRAAALAPRTTPPDYVLATVAERVSKTPRKQLPPGSRRADGRDADRTREYQRAYRARKRALREKHPMTASQAARAAGLPSLAEVTRITGVSYQTLYNWHKDKPELFRAVLIGCAEIKRLSP